MCIETGFLLLVDVTARPSTGYFMEIKGRVGERGVLCSRYSVTTSFMGIPKRLTFEQAKLHFNTRWTQNELMRGDDRHYNSIVK